MRKRLWFPAALALAIALLAGIATTQSAQACGGFFCQNSPIDQNAERIIFTQNHDGTVSALIQIQYTGSAPDFSWILPLPEAIGAEAVEVPEDAMAAFRELEVATDPVFILPPIPGCAVVPPMVLAAAATSDSRAVEVFASGEVGPYGFDVIGSEDPNALFTWLRDNDYRVTEEMEPLIKVYVDEAFVFLAMRLLPDQGAQDIQPVRVTYSAERPMIPLRLTAVAATPDMAVMTWFYADSQAVPVNYAKMEIADSELVFFAFGGRSNYRQLMGQKADESAGQAFITEYAAPTRELSVSHPLLRELRENYPYVTRLNTLISPEEMTIDPTFDYDPGLEDVSNIHDLSRLIGVYDCDRQGSTATSASSAGAAGPAGTVSTQSQPTESEGRGSSAESPAVASGGRVEASSESGAADTGALQVTRDGESGLSPATLSAAIAIGVAGLAVIGGLIALGRRSRKQS